MVRVTFDDWREITIMFLRSKWFSSLSGVFIRGSMELKGTGCQQQFLSEVNSLHPDAITLDKGNVFKRNFDTLLWTYLEAAAIWTQTQVRYIVFPCCTSSSGCGLFACSAREEQDGGFLKAPSIESGSKWHLKSENSLCRRVLTLPCNKTEVWGVQIWDYGM